MEGARCRLESLSAALHAESLHEAYREASDGRDWTYLPYGPFETFAAYRACVCGFEALEGTFFFAIVDRAGDRAVGVSAFLRASPEVGSIEVGHLSYAPVLQRSAMATEAMYLMMRRAFDDWGTRRYEWKCDRLNAPSRAAARRLGFRFEGLFRQHAVTKGRSRDTAWYSITDQEWPGIREALERWLDPANFDETGRQRSSLSTWMPSSAGRSVVEEA
jgi:RimJ/RimL family protein N-acetyltransferase